jgi:hypothetical protein
VVAQETDWAWGTALLDPAIATGTLRRPPPSIHTVFNEVSKWIAAANAQAAAKAAAIAKTAPAWAAVVGAPPPASVEAPQRRLAIACGLDQSTVARALKILVEGGHLIDATPPGPPDQVRHYRLGTPPGVTAGCVILPAWIEIEAARVARVLAAGGTP